MTVNMKVFYIKFGLTIWDFEIYLTYQSILIGIVIRTCIGPNSHLIERFDWKWALMTGYKTL